MLYIERNFILIFAADKTHSANTGLYFKSLIFLHTCLRKVILTRDLLRIALCWKIASTIPMKIRR